jgi:protein-S-isoprenylcysteine O-methyltransferase Ste14
MSVLRAVRSSVIGVVLTGAPLLVPAGLLPGGTWLWPRGLAFVAGVGLVQLAGNIALALWRPAHFQVREQGVLASPEKRQPLIDAVGVAFMMVFAVAWLGFIPLDVFVLHLLPPPAPALAWAAGAATLLGAALTPLAVWQNRFATPNVQDQSGAGQYVVDTGVYRLIRHPIYAGNLLLFGAAPLWLGSWAGFAGASVLLVMTVARIAVEERHLRANVPGYAAYAARVRARLIPFVV